MKRMITKYWNSFSCRIIFIVTLGFVVMAFTISFVILTMSQDVFIRTYGQSLGKVVDQIENEFHTLHQDLSSIIDAIDSSWAFRIYLTDQNSVDNIEMFQNIYQMEHDLNQSLPSSVKSLNVLIVGVNGSHYLSRTETISSTVQQIMQSKAAKAALQDPESMHYTFTQGAFTMTTKNRDTVVVSKALYYQNSKEIYGIIFITLTQQDLKMYYDYFIVGNTSFYLVDQDDIVICSNHMREIGNKMSAFWYPAVQGEKGYANGQITSRNSTILRRELPYQDTVLYGVVDNQLALSQLYNIPLLMFICIAISMVLLFFVVLYEKKTLSPLSRMVDKISQVEDGVFTEYIPIEGTIEIQELATAYNRMLDALQDHICQLVKTQEKQRRYEIKALQMQINPHYIYNTLASIKMLVYQNARDKTIDTIDAFIALLRNTITNTDEFITIQKELENLKHYVLIIHTRYGEAVQVEYYVSTNCYNCMIPKMILQPFIENAFFHAFPAGRKGTIQVIVHQNNGQLMIRIIDDGIGMQQQKANRIIEKDIKKEYFSGIGIHNVHDRLKLLFGDQYGIQIISEVQEGTTVMITIPLK